MAAIVGEGGVLLVRGINEGTADGFVGDAVENCAMNGGRGIGGAGSPDSGLCVRAQTEHCAREKDRRCGGAESYSAVRACRGVLGGSSHGRGFFRC
jgi:hypothetical protein